MIHTATREFVISDGKYCFAYGEVRYTFTVTPGRKAVGWSNTMTGNYSPAERPDVEVSRVEWRWPNIETWCEATGTFGDLLREVPDVWFLEQIEEGEE